MSLQVCRDQVGFLIGRGISKRRACGLIGSSRSGMSYESRTRVANHVWACVFDACANGQQLKCLTVSF